MGKETVQILSPAQRVVAYANKLSNDGLGRRRVRLGQAIAAGEKTLAGMASPGGISDLEALFLLARTRKNLGLLRLFAGAVINIQLRRFIEVGILKTDEAGPFFQDLSKLEAPVIKILGSGTGVEAQPVVAEKDETRKQRKSRSVRRPRVTRPGRSEERVIKGHAAVPPTEKPAVHTKPGVLKVLGVITGDPDAVFEDFRDLFGTTRGKKRAPTLYTPMQASYSLRAALNHLFNPKGKLNGEEQQTLAIIKGYMSQEGIPTWQRFYETIVRERLFPSLPMTPKEMAVFVSYYICDRREALKRLGVEEFPDDITKTLSAAVKEKPVMDDKGEQEKLLEKLRVSSQKKIRELVASFDRGQIKFIPDENLNFLLLYSWLYWDCLKPVVGAEMEGQTVIGGDGSVLGLVKELSSAGPGGPQIPLERVVLDENAATMLPAGAEESKKPKSGESRFRIRDKLLARGFTLSGAREILSKVLEKITAEEAVFPISAEQAKALFPALRGNFIISHRDLMPHAHDSEKAVVKKKEGLGKRSPEREEKETMKLGLDSVVWGLIVCGCEEKDRPLSRNEAKLMARVVVSMRRAREAPKTAQ